MVQIQIFRAILLRSPLHEPWFLLASCVLFDWGGVSLEITDVVCTVNILITDSCLCFVVVIIIAVIVVFRSQSDLKVPDAG